MGYINFYQFSVVSMQISENLPYAYYVCVNNNSLMRCNIRAERFTNNEYWTRDQVLFEVFLVYTSVVLVVIW